MTRRRKTVLAQELLNVSSCIRKTAKVSSCIRKTAKEHLLTTDEPAAASQSGDPFAGEAVVVLCSQTCTKCHSLDSLGGG